jgi:aldose 1-epimerase
LSVAVTYLLLSDRTISIHYEAATDATTVVNLTQHTYFNLAGQSSASVLDHELTIKASRFTPVDGTLIPTGEVAAVDGTPFDFRRPACIGTRLIQDHEQVRLAGGFDHNFALTRDRDGLVEASVLRDPRSGRILTVATTEPGIQFYAGHMLDGSIAAYGRVLANQPHFPSVTLQPGEGYTSTTTWHFTAH